MALYHLNFLNIDRAYQKAIKMYKGLSERELRNRSETFFRLKVKDKILKGAVGSMNRHREDNHSLVLLTNSSCYQADIASRDWGFDFWLANRFPVDRQGNLLGTYEHPLCYGDGKVRRAESLANANGFNLDDSYFYSDSYSDLPMLERVGNPRVVNPDPKLKKYAIKKGWPILDWS